MMYSDFLQIAIGEKMSLSVGLTDVDWQQLYCFCKKQALVGVGFTAVEKLHEQGVVCPKAVRMQWMAVALQIEKCNEVINGHCRILAEQYEHDGLRCCILKGQGNLLNYPQALKNRRTPGDIDVWTVTGEAGVPIAVQAEKDAVCYTTYHGKKGVIEYVMMQHRLSGNGGKAVLRYHHIEAPKIGDTEVEVHFRVGFCNSPLRNWRMQRWFDGRADECMRNRTPMGFAVPTASVNVVYQMTHIFTHFFDEGVGLRQLMDYYFVLKLWYDDYMEAKDMQERGMLVEGLGVTVMSREEIMRTLQSFGMARFAAAVMWVMNEVFVMPPHYYICEPDERRGRELLDEIMLAGNFGQYDERSKEMKNGGMVSHGVWKLKRVMRLVRSYPEEALCEPFFRIWHLGWRLAHR